MQRVSFADNGSITSIAHQAAYRLSHNYRPIITERTAAGNQVISDATTTIESDVGGGRRRSAGMNMQRRTVGGTGSARWAGEGRGGEGSSSAPPHAGRPPLKAYDIMWRAPPEPATSRHLNENVQYLSCRGAAGRRKWRRTRAARANMAPAGGPSPATCRTARQTRQTRWKPTATGHPITGPAGRC